MTVSEQIIEVLNALCEKFGLAIDWTAANVLPYLEVLCGKFINYEIASSIIIIALNLIIWLALLIVTRIFWKRADFDRWEFGFFEGAAMIGLGLTIIASIALVVNLCLETYDIITALTFPEKIIFEEVQELLGR
jgi:predicted permease